MTLKPIDSNPLVNSYLDPFNVLSSDTICDIVNCSIFHNHDITSFCRMGQVNKGWNAVICQLSDLIEKKVDLEKTCPGLSIVDAKKQGFGEIKDEPPLWKLQIMHYFWKLAPLVVKDAALVILTVPKGTSDLLLAKKAEKLRGAYVKIFSSVSFDFTVSFDFMVHAQFFHGNTALSDASVAKTHRVMITSSILKATATMTPIQQYNWALEAGFNGIAEFKHYILYILYCREINHLKHSVFPEGTYCRASTCTEGRPITIYRSDNGWISFGYDDYTLFEETNAWGMKRLDPPPSKANALMENAISGTT